MERGNRRGDILKGEARPAIGRTCFSTSARRFHIRRSPAGTLVLLSTIETRMDMADDGGRERRDFLKQVGVIAAAAPLSPRVIAIASVGVETRPAYRQA